MAPTSFAHGSPPFPFFFTGRPAYYKRAAFAAYQRRKLQWSEALTCERLDPTQPDPPRPDPVIERSETEIP